jgi:hypothetical protein
MRAFSTCAWNYTSIRPNLREISTPFPSLALLPQTGNKLRHASPRFEVVQQTGQIMFVSDLAADLIQLETWHKPGIIISAGGTDLVCWFSLRHLERLHLAHASKATGDRHHALILSAA